MLRKYLSRNMHLFSSQTRTFASNVPAKAAETDFYKVLGVDTFATPEQIKEAYRNLAKRYHPDVIPADDGQHHDPDVEKFRSVVEAYSVLSVSESRAAFDITRKKNPHKFGE